MFVSLSLTQIQESQQPATDARQQPHSRPNAPDDDLSESSSRGTSSSSSSSGSGSNSRHSCLLGGLTDAARCGAQVRRQHIECPRLLGQSQSQLEQQQSSQSARGHAGLVAQWGPHVGRFAEVAGEEDASTVAAAQPLESGVGSASLQGEVQEEALYTSLRSAAAGDAVSVERESGMQRERERVGERAGEREDEE